MRDMAILADKRLKNNKWYHEWILIERSGIVKVDKRKYRGTWTWQRKSEKFTSSSLPGHFWVWCNREYIHESFCLTWHLDGCQTPLGLHRWQPCFNHRICWWKCCLSKLWVGTMRYYYHQPAEIQQTSIWNKYLNGLEKVQCV